MRDISKVKPSSVNDTTFLCLSNALPFKAFLCNAFYKNYNLFVSKTFFTPPILDFT